MLVTGKGVGVGETKGGVRGQPVFPAILVLGEPAAVLSWGKEASTPSRLWVCLGPG